MNAPIYTGQAERDQQILLLHNIAANIAFGSDDPTTPASERVDFYCTKFADELPAWFSGQDKEILTWLVSSK